MKKVIATAIAALVVIAVTWETPRQAQSTAPDGDALHYQGERVRNALLNGEPQEFLNKLAPWLQGRAKLYREFVMDDFEEEYQEEMEDEKKRKEFEEQFKRAMKETDPDGRLGLETYEDLLGMSAAELVCTEFEMLAMQADDEADARREANWYEVDRVVYAGKSENRWSSRNKGKEIQRTFGDIVFMNKYGDTVVVNCVGDGDSWQVIRVRCELDEWELDTDDCAFFTTPDDFPGISNTRDAKRAEGEQMLGSMKNQSRVAYAKTGKPGGSLTGDCWVDEAELKGKYFRVRDEMYSYKGADGNVRGVIVAEPLEDDLGWGLIHFPYLGGPATFEWYDTEAELDKALEDLTGEE